MEKKAKRNSRESGARYSVRRCEASWLGPWPGAGLKTRRLVLDALREPSGINRWAEGVCQGPGHERGPRVPDGVHDFQAEPQRPVLQHPVLRLLPCPHRDDHPGDLVHGGQPVDGNFADC